MGGSDAAGARVGRGSGRRGPQHPGRPSASHARRQTPQGRGLVAPESALLKTGERTLVFVDHGDGRLEPREVQAGSKVAEGVQVLRGLAEGERVVTAANFLLDSESSLKAALAVLSPAPPKADAHAH